MGGEISSACCVVFIESRYFFTVFGVTVKSLGVEGRVSLPKIDEKLRAKENQRVKVVQACSLARHLLF